MKHRKERELDGHYVADNVVSVWLGTCTDAAAYERYVKEDWENLDSDEFPTCLFWKDLGIQWFDHDFQEHGYVGDPMPVTELLDRGWSFLESFREPLLSACRAKGVESANALIFLYDYDYPEAANYSSPHMRFLGVFPYGKERT